jgi:hypothetical protein
VLKHKRAVKHDDARIEQAALAAMLELMFVLGWHNSQTHDYLRGHHFDGLSPTLRSTKIGVGKKHQMWGND